MNIEMAVDIIRMLISHAILLVSPLLLTSISVGVLVSLFQSITSIQEQTLTFVPKLLAMGAIFLLSSNWLIRNLTEFAIEFFKRLPQMAP